jgi:hypothetical protein
MEKMNIEELIKKQELHTHMIAHARKSQYDKVRSLLILYDYKIKEEITKKKIKGIIVDVGNKKTTTIWFDAIEWEGVNWTKGSGVIKLTGTSQSINFGDLDL